MRRGDGLQRGMRELMGALAGTAPYSDCGDGQCDHVHLSPPLRL